MNGSVKRRKNGSRITSVFLGLLRKAFLNLHLSYRILGKLSSVVLIFFHECDLIRMPSILLFPIDLNITFCQDRGPQNYLFNIFRVIEALEGVWENIENHMVLEDSMIISISYLIS